MWALVTDGSIAAISLDLLTRLTIVVRAMAEGYSYRRANNQDAVIAHRSLEYLARYLFGDVQ